jgi:hypothetical protein
MRERLRRRGCPVKTGLDGRLPNDAESKHPLMPRSVCTLVAVERTPDLSLFTVHPWGHGRAVQGAPPR